MMGKGDLEGLKPNEVSFFINHNSFVNSDQSFKAGANYPDTRAPYNVKSIDLLGLKSREEGML